MPNRTLAIGVAATLVLTAGSALAYGPLGFIDFPREGLVRGGVFEVELTGNRAVLLDRRTEVSEPIVRVVDVSSPRRLREIGARTMSGSKKLNGLAAVGGIAFVTAHHRPGGQLDVLDVSGDGEPDRIGKLRFPEPARGVEVANDLAYVTMSSDKGEGSSLRIVDVSALDAPVEIGAVALPGVAHGIALAGDLAFVSVGPESLWVVDISQPDAPSVVGSVGDGARGVPHRRHVEIRDGAVFVSNGRVFDVANPEEPVDLGTLEQLGGTIDFVGSLAYAEGLVLDPDGSEPRIFSGFLGGSYFEIVGDRAYVAAGVFWVYDITRVPIPPPIGALQSALTFAPVEWVGDLAYAVENDTPALHIIDLSSPAAPRERGVLPGIGRLGAVEVEGDLAYLGEGGHMVVVDVSNPDAPQRRDHSTWSVGGTLRPLAIAWS